MNFELADDTVTITDGVNTITLPLDEVVAIADTIRTLAPAPALGQMYRHTTPAKWAATR
ncbi:hypothetical protein [Rhodococcus sp. NPDC004095]